MKKLRILLPLLLLSLLQGQAASGQVPSGRVVINEYMPWTLNGCGTTSEFVELLNFGPGPINIGCYVLTDGDYTITIPPNTILQPGDFYVIAGQDIIEAPCANIDSTIQVDLNWNTCGCTSAPIPSSGDGLFTDGGSANEQVVLLDPTLRVVDAVVRDYPVETSAPIITSEVGGCASQLVDLNTLDVQYETLGMSAGRGNSFARQRDGDCGWVKDPQQSANATNNRDGDESEVRYQFTIVRAQDCDESHGSIDVYVEVLDYYDVFPMNYTIAFDSDEDGLFTFNDTYTYGVDDTPPSIAIEGLPLGRYRLTVASYNDCYLQNFDFSILECMPPLPVGLAWFRLAEATADRHTFEWMLGGAEHLASIVLERSADGRRFTPDAPLRTEGLKGNRHFTHAVPARPDAHYYRLRLQDRNGMVTYSPVVQVAASDAAPDRPSIGPNPVVGQLAVRLQAAQAYTAQARIYTAAGALVRQQAVRLQAGANRLALSAEGLPAGLYYLRLQGAPGGQPISFRFVKQ